MLMAAPDAFAIIIGTVLVLLLFYLSQAYPLRTVGWLIRNLLTYLVFGAIVLFQSDIRRGLSHLGRARFFRYLGRAERTSETIEEVVTAAGKLAKARVLGWGDQLKAKGVTDKYVDGAFGGTTVDGKTVMMPMGKDVSNVIWYNKDVFAAKGLTAPTTWAEFLTLCDTLKKQGITPLSVGNKDLWVAGNWIGHLISRSAGESVYDKVMSKQMPMNSPEFVKGMSYLVDLQKGGYINASANTIPDNEGYSLFLQGKAAMLPIGSWIIGIAQEEAPDVNLGWFNLPSIDGGAGSQTSIMGVTTGYIVNAKSTKQDKAVEFLKDAFSADLVNAWTAAGFTVVAKSANAAPLDGVTQSMVDLLGSGASIVAPPDTGYDLKMADALNTAIAQVLDGVKTPQEALDEAQQKVETQ